MEAGSAIPAGDPRGTVNQVYGEKGQVVLSRPPQIFIRDPWGDLPVGECYEMPLGDKASRRRKVMIEGFANAVLEDTAPPVQGWDGRAALEIIVAAYESGKRHQPIQLPL